MDKKVVSVRKLAAIERAKALGLEIKHSEISTLECQALQWKRREEAEKSEAQAQKSPPALPPTADSPSRAGNVQGEKDDAEYRIQNPASSIPGPVRDRAGQYPASSTNEGFDWQPYRSEQGEGGKKAKNLNTASVARIARKIMAREWAMALGRSGGLESEQANFERTVEKHRQKKATERERKEMEQRRAHKQRKALEEALQSFWRNFLKAPKPVTPDSTEALLREALAEVGDTIRITWQPGECHILLEPWEEKRQRRKNGETMPAVFQATIGDNLNLTSYERVENPQVLQQTRSDMILKNILLSFRKSPRKDSHAFENAVAEGGRIIQSMKMDGGWKIKFEPWEEIRRRNLERKGRPPIVTCVIKADKDFNRVSCERI